jgi:exodeoxyribonuclease V alpha subunit
MTTNKGIKKLRGKYILDAFGEYSLNGDAYMTKSKLFQLCSSWKKKLKLEEFNEDYDYLLKEGYLSVEGDDIYMSQVLRYENYSAMKLATLLQDIEVSTRHLPNVMIGNGNPLTTEQHKAVHMALKNRLSIILGGAGTGKTTLIEALVKYGASELNSDWCLCAPTGKAARNLTTRSGLEAKTLHSALKRCPGDDFLFACELEDIRLLVVDEASMLTLEMFAGLLKAAPEDARIVLVGDPNQLLSVGPGNVMLDLLKLGVPSAFLTTCHRQAGAAGALLENVQKFNHIQGFGNLKFDDGFQFHQKYSSKEVFDHVCKRATDLYLLNKNVQVLSPYNDSTELSVKKLNCEIQERLNPLVAGNENRNKQLRIFRNGDRVMIGKNDKQRNICNGDIGTLCIKSDAPDNLEYTVYFPDGRSATWNDKSGLFGLSLAYAITVHKSQGSEYTEIIMPLIEPFAFTMNRNLIYTAISRAKERVTLIGSVEVLDKAIQRQPEKRLSKLVEKTLSHLSKNQQHSTNRISKAS